MKAVNPSCDNSTVPTSVYLYSTFLCTYKYHKAALYNMQPNEDQVFILLMIFRKFVSSVWHERIRTFAQMYLQNITWKGNIHFIECL